MLQKKEKSGTVEVIFNEEENLRYEYSISMEGLGDCPVH